ncbi:MAG: GatB/YqeY domain-containing protein [Candidatus Nealsonbacteria bacterium]|nr:GatB/YqeY domain-containing protein [Candidatus Nealsonbacteria bacterium]
MSLKVKIQENLKTAMKDGKAGEVSVLRMLLAALGGRETEKRTKIWKQKPDLKTEELEKESQLTDEEIIEAVANEIKKRKEAIELYEKGGRPELAEKEKKEFQILQGYLPEQLLEAKVRELVLEAVAKTGAKDVKEMGKVMAELMPKVKGKADASLVSKIVRESLAK